MCLTIPKKVNSVNGNKVVIEQWDGKNSQEVPTIVDVGKNDWVLTQGGVAIEKISKEQADEIINLIKNNE